MFQGIKKAFGFEKRASTGTLAIPTELMFALFGAVPTAAGVSVSPDAALRSPIALACMRAIAESIASLPIDVMRRQADGTMQTDNGHPVADMLRGDWTPWLSGVETRAAMQMDAMQHGGGYALVVRVQGRATELHRLHPTTVSLEISGDGEPQYRISGGRIVSWRDMLAIHTPGWAPTAIGVTPLKPYSLVELAREAIALDIVMARHQAQVFSRGARPGGLYSIDGKLNDDQYGKLLAWILKNVGGDNAGTPLILDHGAKFTPTQFNSVDMQFLELRQFVVADIARVFRVPQTLVGDLQRAVWRNVEELGRQFLQFTLTPWIEVWEAALARVVLNADERKSSSIEFDDDQLLSADQAARFTALRNAVGGSFLTPDEARAMEGRSPIEGGDKLILQAGQTGAIAPPSEVDTAR